MAEAGGLRCADVKRVDGVWSFVIEDSEVRRVKTASSRRVVAIHSKLIEAGLLEYVERQRSAGHDRLFPTLRADAYGSVTGAYGKLWPLVEDHRRG
jgi:hypothetical protein